jgi:tRNA-uridine 2-sulfurtransferase
MSGGVDSSVAAGLLQEQGYDVVGVFMRLGPENVLSPVTDHPEQHRGCCSVADAGDARAVAARLQIPFYVLNFETDFSKLIDYFVDEYAAGRTPNPCIICNQRLKFGRLVEYAEAVGADRIATGHYARAGLEGGRPTLRRARYRAKDQSYVLFGIEPAVLRRTIFPLGELTKEEVRGHARRFNLALHDKPDSQDICFAPDGDYARVVRSRRPDAFRAGRIRHVDGRDLGPHEGLANFTIGQRRGLRVALGSPVYVVSLDARTATVTVGPKEAILSRTATARRMSWLCPMPASGFRCDAQIRYNHTAAPAEITLLSSTEVRARFDEPQPAVTPGQALVLYRDDEILGGGWLAGEGEPHE